MPRHFEHTYHARWGDMDFNAASGTRPTSTSPPRSLERAPDYAEVPARG